MWVNVRQVYIAIRVALQLPASAPEGAFIPEHLRHR